MNTPQTTPVPATAPAPAGARSGAAQWFTEEVHPHESLLRNYLRQRYPALQASVDDVVQESFLRVWRSALTSRVISTKAFLFITARNLATDLIRRDARNPVVSVADPSMLSVAAPAADPAAALAHEEELQLLMDAIETLPLRRREVLVCKKIKGLSNTDTAERLGISPSTVEDHFTKAVAQLDRALAERGADRRFRR